MTYSAKARSNCLTVLLFLLFPIAAYPDVIWMESTDGDLLPPSKTGATETDLGALGSGFNDIIGSLDAGPPPCTLPPELCPKEQAVKDGKDAFTFTAADTWMFDILSATSSHELGILASIFDANRVLIDSGYFFSSTQPDADFGSLSAGRWYISLVPANNYGQGTYSARMNMTSVPEPGTLALLSLGLVSMAAQRRKRA